MLKGHVFSRQLFENHMFALFVNTFLKDTNGISGNYKNGMAITHSGSNVTVDSGAAIIQGRIVEEDTSTTISAGTENMYCKLVIEIDLDKVNTDSDFEQAYYKILKSASSFPSLTKTNIVKNNAGVYQYELARFRTSANGISEFQDKRTFLDFDTIYDEIRQHIQDIDNGSLYVQKAGDTMTGALYIVKNSLDSFIHSRTINNTVFNSKLGTGQNENEGEASVVLTDNDNQILGRLDVRADGKIYNGMTNNELLESGAFGVITSETINVANGETISGSITYPQGFNASNCVVISKAYKDFLAGSWKYGNENIYNYEVSFGTFGVSYSFTNNSGSSKPISLKLVLMKIS